MSLLEPTANLGIEPAVLKEIYHQMSRMRAVDQAIQRGIASGNFRFSYWPLTGQEAIPATLSTLTTTDDYHEFVTHLSRHPTIRSARDCP